MTQLGNYLRSSGDQVFHWCPACKELHAITIAPNRSPRWNFNSDLDRPTFSPSVRIRGKQHIVDDRGEWTGEWRLGPDGKALDYCCHYFITDGAIAFCSDCSHGLAGVTVPLPPLPDFLRDPQ